MSIQTEQIKSHAVWQRLEELGPVLDDALSHETTDATANGYLTRIKAVLVFTGKRLATISSDLIQSGVLDTIATSLASATTEVQNFLANGNVAHLANANSNSDATLTYLAQINVPQSQEDLIGLREVADNYRNVLETNLQSIQAASAQTTSACSAIQSRLSSLDSELTSERERLTSIASELQSQFASAQETRNTEHIEAQASRQERFASLLAEHTQKLNEQDATSNGMRDNVAQEEAKAIAVLRQDFESKAKVILDQIDAHRLQVEKLVGVIGNLGVTSGYQKTANSARWTARVWQFIAILSLSGIIVVAYKAFIPLVQGSFSWESFAGRVFVTITVGALAAYAISQADKYQQIERRSHKLALELEALGPFLASLPEDKQQEFRLRVGERTFGTTGDLIDQDISDSPKSVLDVPLKSKELRSFVVEIIKALRAGGS